MSITVDDPHMEVFDGSDWKTYTNAPGGWNGGTYHESCHDRDDLTISFKGTGIKIYGAKRPTYGYYYAELDGENRRYFNAHSTRDEIPALLFEVSGIPEGDHSLWMMNQQNYDGRRSRSCWGIDYMVITTGSAVSEGAPVPASSDTATPSDPNPSASAPMSADPAASSFSESPVEEQPSPTGFDTEVGNAMSSSSSSSAENLTVPNLSNYTLAPSADEVSTPTTFAIDSMTAVTGQAGVYSGNPLPVFTGQAINTFGAEPPNLKQEAFVTGAMAGRTSSSALKVEIPILQMFTLIICLVAIRGSRL